LAKHRPERQLAIVITRFMLTALFAVITLSRQWKWWLATILGNQLGVKREKLQVQGDSRVQRVNIFLMQSGDFAPAPIEAAENKAPSPLAVHAA
jgi:hypothetical protein